MPSQNRPYVGRGYIEAQPMKDEEVFCEDRQEYGKVTRRLNNGGGTVVVKFPSEPNELMFTYRAALRVWKQFPGRADSKGLRPLQ